jgi:hypothetical protein
MTLWVVVPDDATSSALADSLSQLGFTVSRIPGLAELAEWVKHRRPELVLCPHHAVHAQPFGLAKSILCTTDVAGGDRRTGSATPMLEACASAYRCARPRSPPRRSGAAGQKRSGAADAFARLQRRRRRRRARTGCQFQRDQRAGVDGDAAAGRWRSTATTTAQAVPLAVLSSDLSTISAS